MTKTKVIEVYNKVMKRAQELRKSSEERHQDMAQELYWVAGLLENTEEVNPTK